MNKKLDQIYQNSERLPIDNTTKIVIMSDCHRGAGDNFDNFIQNQNIYKSALEHYYDNNFTYIELGDGDEMWEVENYEDIIKIHQETFNLLKKFHDFNRLIMIYGNHDIEKSSPVILKKYFYKYYDEITKQNKPLLSGLTVYESLVLNYRNYDIFLVHGHQVDFLNSTLWRLSRFLVRHLWKNLEHLGISDPTSAAKYYQVTKNVEKELKEWSIENNKIIIAGHTHRAIFPQIGQSLYFNDGSCIHPNGITCIEIENGNITLIKWEFETNEEELLSVKRKTLSNSEPIINFYKKK